METTSADALLGSSFSPLSGYFSLFVGAKQGPNIAPACVCVLSLDMTGHQLRRKSLENRGCKGEKKV